MPILDVEIITRPDETISPNLAGEIAHRAGDIFGSPAGNTWVKVRALPVENYAENDDGSAGKVYPVFVSVLKGQLPEAEELRREAGALAVMVAQVCDRPVENVHILYEPAGAGRIAFGGQI